jgi:hypothetical protein
LSGPIPSSIGSLSQLKELHLHNNKELSGAFPLMSSKGCNIYTNGTGISRVEIKTKPLNNTLDYFFVVSHVVIGYIDLVLDILAIIALSSQQNIPIMIANILFIVLNVLLAIWMSRDDVMGIIRTVLQLDQLYQGYMTLSKGHQTYEMIVSKKIDAVTRSMPSMILQLYGLLKSLSSQDSSDNSLFLDSFLSSNQILLLSVASSIAGAGFTLASLAPNSGTSIFNKHFVIHYVYYTAEITNRVVILSVMFFTVDAYAYIVAGLDFLHRLVFGTGESGIERSCNLLDGTLLAIQSFGSDHTVPGPNNIILYIGFTMSTIEMFIFLIVLNTLKTDPLVYAHSHGASTILTVVSCVTWFIRLVFYYTGVLDIAPEPTSVVSKDAPMASKEEGAMSSIDDISISVNRIDNCNDKSIV